MAVSATHNGWRFDPSNSRLDFYYRGTRAGHIDAAGVEATGTLTVTGAATLSSTLTIGACAPTYTFPADDGSCGQQLTTNGSLALSWAAASLGAYKTGLGVLCSNESLETLKSTPVRRFVYDRSKIPPQTWAPSYEMTGFFAEEAPWAMQGKKREVFSPMNAIGVLASAIKALAEKVERLEARTA
jgi:hypothetical protein